MSGRGRGLTLPAWMTEQQANAAQAAPEPVSSSANYGNNRDDRYADAPDGGYSNNYSSNARDNNRYSDARDNNYSNSRDNNYANARDNGNRYNDNRSNDSRGNQFDTRDVRHSAPAPVQEIRPVPPVRDEQPGAGLPDGYQSKRRKKTSGWDQTSAPAVADQQTMQALNKAFNAGPAPSGGSKAGTRIYVGSIHYDLREPDIVALFQSFGNVIKSEMTMDPQTGRSKGFCFLEYETPEQAEAAMAMDGFDLAGRRIKVGRPTHGQGGAMSNNGASLNLAMSMGMQMTNQVAPVPAPINPMLSGLNYLGQQNNMQRDLTIGGQLLLPSSVGSSNNYSSNISNNFVSGDTRNSLLVRYVSALVPIAELNSIFSSFGELRRCRFVEPGKVSGMPSNARAAVVEFANPAVATSTAPAMAGFLIGDMEIAIEVISKDRAEQLLTVDTSSYTTVVLRDMVTLQDVEDPYLKDELAEEGNQYGRLQNVLIEVRDTQDGSRRREVVVELLYYDPADAHKAHRALNGRAFGGKPINAVLAPAK